MIDVFVVAGFVAGMVALSRYLAVRTVVAIGTRGATAPADPIGACTCGGLDVPAPPPFD